MSQLERRQTRQVSTWARSGEQAIRLWNRLTGSGRAYSFRRRRVIAFVAVAMATTLMMWMVSVADASLLHRGVMTGWTLMACLVMLIAIGVRRRIPILPLGKMSTWTQVHLYTGAFTIGVFLMHTPSIFRGQIIANGYFEGSLSLLFWAVSASGVYGLIASRRLPVRLTNVGEQIRFDQIQWRREQICDRATDEIASLETPAAVRVLGEFHEQYLSRYFRYPPTLLYLLIPTSVRRRRTMAGLVELTRYLDEEGKTACGNLAALVRHRDDLDYQYALQLRLRLWVVGHATASIALIVMAIIHGILALRFVES